MKIIREVLFSPGNITEKEKCYDRLEPLRKLDISPVFQSETEWEAERRRLQCGICGMRRVAELLNRLENDVQNLLLL